MKKRDKDASELDRLFFGSLALCTAIGIGAIVWHLRLPDITTDYLRSDSFKKDFGDRVKQLSGLDVTFGKIESGTGLGFAMSDVRVRSTDGQAVNCRIERVQGELGRDLKFADVRRLRLTRPVCQLTVDSGMQPTWRPEVAKVGAGDLKLLLGARLRGVSLEDAEVRMVQAAGNGWKEAARVAHFDVEAEGDVDVQGFNVTAEIKGNKATRLSATLANGGAELGFEGAIKAILPRTGDLRLTAEAQLTEPAGTHFVGPKMLPLGLGLDAGLKSDGKIRFDRLQVSNPQFKTVLRGLAVNAATGDAVAAKFETSAINLTVDPRNELVVRDANLSVDASVRGGVLDVALVFAADDVRSASGQTYTRGIGIDGHATLEGGGRLAVKKLKVTAGGDLTLVALTGIIDARTLPPSLDLTGDFRQSLAPFDFGPAEVRGSVDGSIKVRSSADGALVVEGMATVEVPEARYPSLVIENAKADLPFRFEITHPDRLAEWLDVTNPDQLLDRYFTTAKSFDVTARGSVGLARITPRAGTKDSDVTFRDVAIDSTYRLVAATGRTELWGSAKCESIVAPPLDGSPIRDLKYKVDAGFAYHQDNGGSVDFALDFVDKFGRIPPTRVGATVRSFGREVAADYHVNGPLFALLAKTVGLDVLLRHESAEVAGQVRFTQLLNKMDLKTWAFLPFNFPYQGEVAGNGKFELRGISYDYLEGVRRISVPALAGTYEHGDGGAGHRVEVVANADEATVQFDNGTDYRLKGVLASVNGSFQMPFPSASAPFRVEIRGKQLTNGKNGARFPDLKMAAVFDVQKAQSLKVAAIDVMLAGEKLVTGSGIVGGFYPLAGVDLWGDVKLDTKKFRGLTALSEDLGEVRIPLRLSSANGNSLRLVGSVLRRGDASGTSAAPKMIPLEVEWKVAGDNHVELKLGALEDALPGAFFDNAPSGGSGEPQYRGKTVAH